MSNLNDLYDERCRIDKEQRELNDAVLERDGVYTSEEEEKYQKMDKRFEEVTDLIREEEAREEKLKQKAENLAKRGDLSKPERETEVRNDPPVVEKATAPEVKVAERYMAAFNEFRKLHPNRVTPEYRESFRDYLRFGEKRALQARFLAPRTAMCHWNPVNSGEAPMGVILSEAPEGERATTISRESRAKRSEARGIPNGMMIWSHLHGNMQQPMAVWA